MTEQPDPTTEQPDFLDTGDNAPEDATPDTDPPASPPNEEVPPDPAPAEPPAS